MIGSISSRLCTELGLTFLHFSRLVTRAPHSYKVYSIPKKTEGFRLIAQPAKETKIIQRWLMENIFSSLPVHSAASAYKPGASIKKNALAHTDNAYITKLDFQSFFPSISEHDIFNHVRTHLSEMVNEEEARWISRVVCFRYPQAPRLGLSIGAPSSPLLSNSVMYEFDSKIAVWCENREINYTRYADDLTFSSNHHRIGFEIEGYVQSIINEIASPKLFINHKKTTHVSKKFQRRITGVVISNNGTISPGRERKREVRVLIHYFLLGKLAIADLQKLQGLLGFSQDIEPEFVHRMRQRYGTQIIDEIFQARK